MSEICDLEFKYLLIKEFVLSALLVVIIPASKIIG